MRNAPWRVNSDELHQPPPTAIDRVRLTKEEKKCCTRVNGILALLL